MEESPKTLFALYLRTSGPGVVAGAARRATAESRCEAAATQWSGRIAVGTTTRAELVTLLGEPDSEDGATIGYLLEGWPGHRYQFRFDTHGRLRDAGFERTGATLDTRAIREHPDWPGVLVSIGATWSEVRAILGAPDDESGWWPIEDWQYGDELIVEFRHGIVECVGAPPPKL